jgi:hypothetical protein
LNALNGVALIENAPSLGSEVRLATPQTNTHPPRHCRKKEAKAKKAAKDLQRKGYTKADVEDNLGQTLNLAVHLKDNDPSPTIPSSVPAAKAVLQDAANTEIPTLRNTINTHTTGIWNALSAVEKQVCHQFPPSALCLLTQLEL